MRVTAYLKVCLLGALCAGSAVSEIPVDRPSIGLVLSGGGARGAAHVGVIKVLDELRVPVDYIAGTSMGAVIGGLYAAGLSAEELETVIRDSDWPGYFTDRPPRRERSFRRKSDDSGFLVNFDVGVDKSGLVFPPGLIQGQTLGLALKRFTLPTTTIDDFDELPIPFRAVATDIVSGEAVILGSGDLATAIQASMAAPGVFNPIRIDGRVLVDGGVANNLPVQIVQAMGADVLIVVNVGFPLLPEEDLGSAFDITSQMLTILIEALTRQQLGLMAPDDILILPNLGLLGSQQFERAVEAMDEGEFAARALAARLGRWSLEPSEYRDHRAAVLARQRPIDTVDQMTVKTESRLSPKVIESRIESVVGKPFDVEQLERDIGRVYGFDTFETVTYDLREEEGQVHLHIEANEKSWGPNYLRFGLNLEDDFDGGSSYNFGTRYTRAEVNRLGGETRIELQIGEQPGFLAELYQPLDYHSRWFVNPQLSWDRANADVFAGGDRVAQFRAQQTGISLGIGRQLGNWGELRLTTNRSRQDADIRIGDRSLEQGDVQLGNVALTLGFDTIDRFTVPREGLAFNIGWLASRPGLGADQEFDVASLFFLKPRTWGNNTLMSWWDIGSVTDKPAEPAGVFSLGGLFNLSGFGRGAFVGDHLAIGRLLYYRRLGPEVAPVLDTPLYVGASVEYGNTWLNKDDIAFDNAIAAGSVFVVLDTLLGPLYLAYGRGEGGEDSFYLFLGPNVLKGERGCFRPC